jgi:hypothetical protein
MHRWEFVLRKDRASDLSDLEVARDWMHNVTFSPDTPDRLRAVMMAAVLGRPTADDAAEWRRAVHALRSVARRMKGFKSGRSPKIDSLEADAVMEQYLGLMKPILRRDRNKPVRSADPPIYLVPDVPADANGFATASSVFWQTVFLSFSTGFGAHVCADCGVELPLTKGKRASRAQRCRKHQMKHYWQEMGEEKRREVWAKAKAKQRNRK